jgi:hypothetical protein
MGAMLDPRWRSEPIRVFACTCLLGALSGCPDDPITAESSSPSESEDSSTSETPGDGDPTGDGDGDPTGDGDGDGTLFDMAPLPDLPDRPPIDMCKVIDDMNAIGTCREIAPPDAFEPDIQWDWWGPDSETESFVPALVANLTDDNDDGAIDLCDTPDIIVVATDYPSNSHVYVLDGASGQLHFQIPTLVAYSFTPAIGDIDADGIPEIVAAIGPGISDNVRIIAFEHDGTHKWTSSKAIFHNQGGSIALADLDNDGDVEVFVDRIILDHEGNLVYEAPEQNGVVQNSAVTAADLDGDDDLEVIVGQMAYHHDGTMVYNDPTIRPGFPQVGNLDDDPEPEILVTNFRGLTLVEHDGVIKYQDLWPDPTYPSFRPAAIHDFDGDGIAEFAVSSPEVYTVYESTPTILWSAVIDDSSGWAGGTAFDFDGDGIAEAMYADQQQLFVFDGDGIPLLTVPRSSRTLTEYPTVADVDNDGSAEIIVVSDAGFDNIQTSPTVQVIRDIEDRWIQARRIWNQHTYHVTNVREDGTIPQWEPPNWANLNTFRTNAQIEGGEICKPDAEG